MAFKHARAAGKFEDTLVNPGGFHHAAALGDVAEQHRQATVFGIGVVDVADAAAFAIQIQRRPHAVLREGFGGTHAAGRSFEAFDGFFVGRIHHIPFGQRVFQTRRVHSRHGGIQTACAVEFGQNAHHAAGAVHVFHIIVVVVGRGFAQAGNLAADAVDVGHFEIDARFGGGGQQMQYGVGGAAHRHVKAHGVFKCGFGGDVAR